MVRHDAEPEPTDHDERLGEAIEAYLALAEAGPPPEPEAFAARLPRPGRRPARRARRAWPWSGGWSATPGGHGPGSRLETGPADRRLPDRPRAGPGRHGGRLRGRPRRPRPPGRAEGAGEPRRARLERPPAVPQRGADRRRAAPHAHRPGLRRRPGRRPLLLRDAADRGERARPGDPPPPPRPRHGRRLELRRASTPLAEPALGPALARARPGRRPRPAASTGPWPAPADGRPRRRPPAPTAPAGRRPGRAGPGRPRRRAAAVRAAARARPITAGSPRSAARPPRRSGTPTTAA